MEDPEPAPGKYLGGIKIRRLHRFGFEAGRALGLKGSVSRDEVYSLQRWPLGAILVQAPGNESTSEVNLWV